MSASQPVEPLAFKAFEHQGWQNAAIPYHNFFEPLTRQTIQPMLDALGVTRGTRLLDVATGPGYVAEAAAQRGASVVGVDFSAAMVALAGERQPQIEFREGDAEALPFPDQTFDVVAINFGMLHFARPEQALAEAYRVLHAGGRVGFSCWATPDKALGFQIVLSAIQMHGNLNAPLPPGPPFFRFSDPHECERALHGAGFHDPRVVELPMSWRLPWPDGLFEAFYNGTARTGPLLRAQSPEALNAIRSAIREAASAFVKGEWIELPMPAVLTLGVK